MKAARQSRGRGMTGYQHLVPMGLCSHDGLEALGYDV
jgi:hypothetical protein